MKIHKATYLISSPNYDQCLVLQAPEYAFIGRSNVGKSSIINAICGQKGLAKTSSAPGKTQLINHFEIISNEVVKDVFDALWNNAATFSTDKATALQQVDAVIDAKGLKQMNDSGALEAIIDAVLAANPDNVEQFRAGKEKAFNALVGQAMKASKGKANPAQVNEMLKKKLS